MNYNFRSFKGTQIKRWISENTDKINSIVIQKLCTDTRDSVRNIGCRLLKKEENKLKEIVRLKKMLVFEKKYKGRIIGGCDEAGRGPLCGPVVASIVILPEDKLIFGLNDSKKIVERKRNELFKEIKEVAVDIGIGIVDNNIVDEINILNATFEAVKIAYDNLSVKPNLLLTDYLNVKDIKVEQVPLVKGDSKSLSIAAASIIAKVTRDKIMYEYHKKYPDYMFNSNKGYGTKKHIEKLKEIGPCSIHRKSFIKNFC